MDSFGFLRRCLLDTDIAVADHLLCLGPSGVDGGIAVRDKNGDERLCATFEVTLQGQHSPPECDLGSLTARTLELLPCDEGPERVGVRVPVSLSDGDGKYSGDGLQEVSVRPDGTVLLGLGLRILPVQPCRVLRSVGWKVSSGGRLLETVAASGTLPELGANSFGHVGDWVVLKTGDRYLGVFWGCDLPEWCDRAGGEGLWPKIGDGRAAPFFHGWENHLRQWHGPHGWRARDSARLVLKDRTLVLDWHTGSELPAASTLHFSGAAAVLWATSEDEIRRRLGAIASPVATLVEGAELAGFDYLEGSYRVRKISRECRVVFPATSFGSRTLLRVDVSPTPAVSCRINGEPVRPQLVSVSRVDDPYGPHEGRPDSDGRPVLAAFEKPAERIELGVQLQHRKPTIVDITECKGVSLSYLAQDDRRELLLFSSLDERPVGRLSLADLKLRDLRLPEVPRPAITILPLYWFLMNAPSRYHSANVLQTLEVAENGPNAIRLSLSATNPGEKVRSTVKGTIPQPSRSSFIMDISAELEILDEFPVPHFQFCNLFPEVSRMPNDWTHGETFIATKERHWTIGNRSAIGKESTLDGEPFRDFQPPFFLSQYASESGNFALLVRSVQPVSAWLGYELCRCWLDNHLFVTFPEGKPRVGERYAVDYQLALWGGRHTTREEVCKLARDSLASGTL